MFTFRQSRIVCAVFYALEDVLSFIDRFKFDNGQYAYVYHDKDKNSDGTDKVPHYHFFGKRSSPITQQTLRRFAATTSQNVLFQNLKSTEHAFLAYFTHDECTDKVPYDIADIVANFDVGLFLKTEHSGVVDPAVVVALFDQGKTTLDIIRQYPKLIYSVASLQRFEHLVRHEKYQQHLEQKVNERTPVQLHVLTPLDIPDSQLPF